MNALWNDEIDHAALQAEWRELKTRLDALIDEAWAQPTREKAFEIEFAIRMVRARINELATITTFAERDSA